MARTSFTKLKDKPENHGKPEVPGKPPGKPETGAGIMKFIVETKSGAPTSDLSFTIEIPDEAAREYTTVVNAGIAAIVAKAGQLLIGAENEQDIAKFMAEGMSVASKVSSL